MQFIFNKDSEQLVRRKIAEAAAEKAKEGRVVEISFKSEKPKDVGVIRPLGNGFLAFHPTHGKPMIGRRAQI